MTNVGTTRTASCNGETHVGMLMSDYSLQKRRSVSSSRNLSEYVSLDLLIRATTLAMAVRKVVPWARRVDKAKRKSFR